MASGKQSQLHLGADIRPSNFQFLTRVLVDSSIARWGAHMALVPPSRSKNSPRFDHPFVTPSCPSPRHALIEVAEEDRSLPGICALTASVASRLSQKQ